MKKILITTLLTTAFLTPNLSYANQQIAESLCGNIEVDNKTRFRKVLRENKLRVRQIFDSVLCDNQDLLRFAISSNANSVGGLIASKLPLNTLSEPAADGKTLLQWADELGHSSSPVVLSVIDKINK